MGCKKCKIQCKRKQLFFFTMSSTPPQAYKNPVFTAFLLCPPCLSISNNTQKTPYLRVFVFIYDSFVLFRLRLQQLQLVFPKRKVYITTRENTRSLSYKQTTSPTSPVNHLHGNQTANSIRRYISLASSHIRHLLKYPPNEKRTTHNIGCPLIGSHTLALLMLFYVQ